MFRFFLYSGASLLFYSEVAEISYKGNTKATIIIFLEKDAYSLYIY